ncbi:MAG: (2Fe-2S)-binding protein [Chloroflexota bacterium]|jgi:predicted molibdopterin-dependent oxidoreductase YjgC
MMRYFRGKNNKETTVIHFSVDGQVYTAIEGDTIASALYAAGVRAWRRSHSGDLRGLFCGIGHCFDCLVTVNGVPNVRACQTLVEPEMVILTNMLDKE